MKKIISITTAVIMLLSATGVFAAPVYTDNVAHLLKDLNIMQGDPDGNMRYDDFVSRAECVKVAVASSAFRDSVATGSKTSPFSDVLYSHWAAPYITVGVKNGLCKGYLDATFRPDNTVLYEEAAAMFLRILSYSDADFGSSWPEGPVGLAKNIGILDNVNKTTGDELTRRDIATIAYNTLNAKTNTNPQMTYLSTFSRTIVDDVVLIATSAEDPTIADGKIFTSAGTYNFTDTLDLSYMGTRGSIVLRNGDTVVSFIPEKDNQHTDNQMVYATLSNGIITYKDGNFKQIDVNNNTVFYLDSSKLTGIAALNYINTGDTLRINYKPNGEIDYIRCTEGTIAGPVTVTSSAWYESFGITPSDVSIIKNGEFLSASDIKTNDILYNLPEFSIVLAISEKVTGVFQSALPNKESPSSIIVSNTSYSLDGLDAFTKISSDSLDYGDTITLLMSRTGKVADVISSDLASEKTETYMVYSTLGDNIITYKDGDFSQFELENNTKIYKDSSVVTSAAVLPILKMGDVLKVSYDSDNEIDFVEFSEGSTKGPETVKASDWYTDFGADSSVTVFRNGQKSSVSDVKINDIAYYSKELDIAFIYSKRVTGIYQSASPNKDAPTSVTVSGITYQLEGIDAFTKLSSNGSFNFGDTVTLLLGESGGVADVATNSQLSETVYGFMTEAGAKQTIVSESIVTKPYIRIALPTGEVCEYVTDKDLSDSTMRNSAVCVTLKDSTATVTAAPKSDTSGKFVWNSSSHKFGSTPLASDVKILEVSTTTYYETAKTATVFPQRLNGATIPASSVLYAHKNSDGYIDELILDDTTGDMHYYGIVTHAKNNTGEMMVSGSYEFIANGFTHSYTTTNKAFNISSGQVAKITATYSTVTNQFANYISMAPVNKTASGKITDITGSKITIDGKSYTMSDNVQFYVKENYDYTMLTLDEVKSIMTDHNAAIYQDKPENSGGRVRIIILS